MDIPYRRRREQRLEERLRVLGPETRSLLAVLHATPPQAACVTLSTCPFDTRALLERQGIVRLKVSSKRKPQTSEEAKAEPTSVSLTTWGRKVMHACAMLAR